MVVCRYCALESAVSHASEQECIEELNREVTRLKDHLPHGQPDEMAVLHRESEPIVVLSLPGSHR
jgi:hypothetical protein